MYESVTYEGILKRMLSRVPGNIDKREGSIIFDALAPAAVELQNMYIELDWMYRQSFADTADREYLIMRCGERGITPYPATKAILKGEFNREIEEGTRFSLDQLNYRAAGKISGGVYRVECETEGADGNRYLGNLVPIEYCSGLKKAVLTEVLIPGEDEEETEHLRKRYFDSLSSQAYGGNIADYREKVNALAGVGGVKVFPVWNGGGTVKLVIISSEYGVPSAETVVQVKEQVDPSGQEGTGYGLAPIGHTVTVEAVKEKEIKIDTILTYQTGWNQETCREGINRALDQYLEELNRSWESRKTTVIRISQIESRLLDVEGILDISGTRLNGNAGNLELPEDSLPVRGEFTDEGG